MELARGDFAILVENTKIVEQPDEPAYGEVVFYTPVETVHSSTRRHAAEVRQRKLRTRVAASTLCSRAGTRRVERRLHEPLSNVTCVQCRAILAEEGEL
ncbi:hypothetical protein [Actinokineospora fastidiosa]|uniref:Uncharacterized protein n=1 Tax=Actinokineospora fastidiosa TaxID=1816 RepID=A0A918GHT7_9PSEU|nr:hypothetical protein [Actinokineospora fastidiosa]GGS33584.1 hypothetical protein GCM10010171_29780 [Actinokineospora fastidiosa]